MAIDHVEHLRSDAPALAAAARSVPLDTPVPRCPGWSVADLLAHTGRVHRWAAFAAANGRAPEKGELEWPPEEPEAAPAYYDAGWPPLVEVLAALDPDAPGWNFAPVPQVRGFWRRRQAQETLVHRIDAESAAGIKGAVDPVLAADGIDEVLEVMAPRRLAGRDGIDIGGSVHVHCTDTDGEWTFRTDDGLFQLSRGHSKGDVAVRGPARSLLLVLWGRLPADDPTIERFGDRAVLDRWFALTPTP